MGLAGEGGDYRIEVAAEYVPVMYSSALSDF